MSHVEVNRLSDIFEAQSIYRWELRKTTAQERIDKITRLRDVWLSRTDEIAEALISDFTRPMEEAKNQVFSMVPVFNQIIDNLEQWMQPEEYVSAEGSTAQVIYEPIGVVCIFGTWNAPPSVTIHPLAEAVAAGNCAVIKPSEFTPAFNKTMKEILAEVFEEKEVAVVEGEADVSSELLNYPFNHFFFTGSPKIGKIVMAGAAKHLAAVTLELGGKSPVILDRNIDFTRTAQRLAYCKILMGGQFCISPDYIFVHEEDVEVFVQNYSAVVQGMLYDNGVIRNEDRTQIVNEGHYNRLKGLFEDAVAKGAIVLSGGTFNDSLRLIEPTILGNVTDDMDIAEEEIFGPLTFIKPYKDVSDVIQYIRKKPSPLALYIFSEDEQFQQGVLQNTASGGVTINDVVMHNVHPELPFGGVNNSGIGKFHGKHGFKTFSHNRGVYTVVDTKNS